MLASSTHAGSSTGEAFGYSRFTLDQNISPSHTTRTLALLCTHSFLQPCHCSFQLAIVLHKPLNFRMRVQMAAAKPDALKRLLEREGTYAR
jgi:hypothetical protein